VNNTNRSRDKIINTWPLTFYTVSSASFLDIYLEFDTNYHFSNKFNDTTDDVASVSVLLILDSPFCLHWKHRIHKTRDKINTRVNRRDNQEWTTQRHWQHRIHKTHNKINNDLTRKIEFLHTNSKYSWKMHNLCSKHMKLAGEVTSLRPYLRLTVYW
jgi:hypothetical protein